MARGLPKALKSVLVLNIVPTHHRVKSTARMGICIHNSLLNSRTWRLKTAVNVIALSTNEVETNGSYDNSRCIDVRTKQ